MTADNKWYFSNTTQNYTSQVTENDNKVIDITTSDFRYGGVSQLVEATAGEEKGFLQDRMLRQ